MVLSLEDINCAVSVRFRPETSMKVVCKNIKWYDETHSIIAKREYDNISPASYKCSMISVCESYLYTYETRYWSVLFQ